MHSLMKGRAQRMQLAADGEWEKSLMLAHCASQLNDMTSWLHAAPRDVALEVFLADNAGHEQFFGVRLSALSRSQQARFCSAAFTFFDVPGRRTAQDILQFARDALAAPQLLNSKPAFLELGVVNAWRSTGPVRFALSAFAPTADLALRQALDEHSRYRDRHSNPIAIELACDIPLPHWLGIVVSRRQGNSHRIDVEAAAALCRAVDTQQMQQIEEPRQ